VFLSRNKDMIPLEWICFSSHVGHAVAARNYILALKDLYDIRIVPFDKGISKAITRTDFELLYSLEKKKENSESIQIIQSIPDMFRRVKRKGKSIGLVAFEAPTMPKRWAERMNTCDVIVAPSSFCSTSFSRLKVPVYTVPHCLNYELYRIDIAPKYIYDKFTFFFIGTWKERKGWKTLIHAWNAEFANNSDVKLIIKTSDVNRAKSGIHRILKKEVKNIEFLTGILLDEELPSLYRSFDCLVLPTIGEGFGLPGLQSLSVGVPIIVTNYSGVREYATQDNACLLEPEGFVKLKRPVDGYYQFVGQSWPVISIDQLRSKMRYVYTYHNEMKLKAERSWQWLSRNFGYEKTAEKMSRIIDYLD